MTSADERPIVLVSNRGPISFERDTDGALVSRRGAGGLVSGIGPLVAGTATTWLAAAITEGDREMAGSSVVEADGFRVAMLSIEPEIYRLAYDVVSNEVLWFAHHGLWDRVREPAFDKTWDEAWDAYRSVNLHFAATVAEVAEPESVVLVQDYHLCLVAARLAQVRPDLTCVHFTHTPFAPPDWLGMLPAAAVAELLAGLAAHRACGFHATRWASDFTDSARTLAGLSPTAFVAPLASDPSDMRDVAASPECAAAFDQLTEQVAGCSVIGRVDRMELSKNQVRGFRAFGDLLERHPEHRGKVVFVAASYPSRTGVAGYAEYRAEVEHSVAVVNDRWGTDTWTPILIHTEDDHPRSVALLRRADVILVNPIRDGLNLVASEAALVNERDAVLALSSEAGAWERLRTGALTVPPFDVSGTADVLHDALTMPTSARSELGNRLRALVHARTPRHWLADQLTAAGRAGPRA